MAPSNQTPRVRRSYHPPLGSPYKENHEPALIQRDISSSHDGRPLRVYVRVENACNVKVQGSIGLADMDVRT